MSSQPELNHPTFNSPIPCSWGASCSYTGCCRFVHPGEEGTGRKLFPGRITYDKTTRAMYWEPPVVRLIGSSTFYERRRRGFSWQGWVSYMQREIRRFKECTCNCGKPATVPDFGGRLDDHVFCYDCYFDQEFEAKFGGAESRLVKIARDDNKKAELYKPLLHIVDQVLEENKEVLAECGMASRNVTSKKILTKLMSDTDAKSLAWLMQEKNHHEMAHQLYCAYEDIFYKGV